MSWFSGSSRSSQTGSGPERRAQPAVEEQRRAIRSGTVATGTLACHRCDAPIAAGPVSLSLRDRLSCPFCSAEGPVRDFLSLAAPTRPTRVVIRIGQAIRY